MVKNIYENNSLNDNCFEIIFVNDGSTDNSQELLDNLVQNNKNIICLKQDNQGIASARNLGLSNASGKYVTFMDQDDFLIDGYNQYIKICEKENVDYLISNPYNSLEGEKHLNEIIKENRVVHSSDTFDLARNLLSTFTIPIENSRWNNVILPSTIWNCIYKKEFLDHNNISFYHFVDYEDDWIFSLDCLSKAKSVYLSNKGYYCWNLNENSESHTHKYIENHYEKRLNLQKWIIAKLKEINTPNEDIDKFINTIFRKRTLIYSLQNETFMNDYSFSKAFNELKRITKKEKDFRKHRLTYNGFNEKLLVFLLLHNMEGLSLLLNRHIFRRTYH